MLRVSSLTCWICAVFVVVGVSITHADEKRGIFKGAKSTEYPEWFNQGFLDFNDDIRSAKKAGKRLMIVFTQPGCPYCNALVERNLAQKDIEQKIRRNFDVIALNMWGDREVTYIDGKSYTEKSISEKLKIQFTPTILFFNEKAKVILRLNGYVPPRRFNVALDYVAMHEEGQMSYRAYVRAHLPAGKSGGLIKEDFFMSKPFDLSLKGGRRNRPLAVFFEQKHCPNCEVLHNKVLKDKLTRSIVKQFDTLQLDMWSNRQMIVTPSGKKMSARNWAKILDIKYAPTIVIFNKSAKEIIRSEAFFKVFHTQGMFTYVLDEGYKTQPSFQRYLSARAGHLIEQGRNVNIDNFKSEHAR